MHSIPKFVARSFFIVSTLFFWGWLAVVIESDTPLFSPYNYSSSPIPYQMSGNHRAMLEFKAGVLNNGDAALKASEFYREINEHDSEVYWLYKATRLGNLEAKKRLHKCLKNQRKIV